MNTWDGEERRVENDRLARIETKLDKLSDAVVAIARTEEQIANILNTQRAMLVKIEAQSEEITKLRERSHDLTNQVIVLNQCKERVEKLEEDQLELKLDTHDNTTVIKKIEKVTWTVVSVIISSLAYMFTRD